MYSTNKKSGGILFFFSCVWIIQASVLALNMILNILILKNKQAPILVAELFKAFCDKPNWQKKKFYNIIFFNSRNKCKFIYNTTRKDTEELIYHKAGYYKLFICMVSSIFKLNVKKGRKNIKLMNQHYRNCLIYLQKFAKQYHIFSFKIY